MKNKMISILPIIVFVLLIFGFTIGSVLKPDTFFSENENRYLAEAPELSKESLLSGKYSREYDTYISDQFIWRDQWIGIKTLTERGMLKQENNGVYFGKDGYLIEKHEKSDFNKKQVKKNIKRLGTFAHKYQKELGSEHLKVMMVPSASQVLSNKLPLFAPNYDQDEFMEQVKLAVPEGSFIDPTDLLKEHNEEEIFYHTDHHWTSQGAFYAYEQWAKESGLPPLQKDDFIIEEASNQFYGTIYSKVHTKLKPDTIELYNIKKDMNYQLEYNMGEKETKTLYDKSQLKGQDKYAVFLGGNNAIVNITTNNKNNKKLLVIKDSFAHSFIPFAVNHYEETIVVDFRYLNMGMDQLIKDYGITDVLVLYNTVKFMGDKNTTNFVK